MLTLFFILKITFRFFLNLLDIIIRLFFFLICIIGQPLATNELPNTCVLRLEGEKNSYIITIIIDTDGFLFAIHRNKAGYTATEVACRWAGAIFEVTRPFGQEQ